ncbi:hypothetical protein GCM10010402_73790 [Actinomadura luteofluorescens]|uniref:DUF397 domain-containing protein n=1 Tax=Actinomadura luteofluorescens TaxID=46163 RepID=UPI002164C160|nr:DUF397 domain-containing protein [Actinomadura glauciflava]MCR3741386.1 protein of unknown function (DUF397) [Actinomadura glauciflava]
MDLSIAVWRKAARSSNNGGDCVEVARVGEVVAVRDGKDPDGPKLLLTPPGAPAPQCGHQERLALDG